VDIASEPHGLSESGDHWHNADENKGRQEADSERQYRFDSGSLRCRLSSRPDCAAPVVGEVLQHVGECCARVVRANQRPRD
jgi:hypothetical protein